jgi:hypothetical protein
MSFWRIRGRRTRRSKIKLRRRNSADGSGGEVEKSMCDRVYGSKVRKNQGNFFSWYLAGISP